MKILLLCINFLLIACVLKAQPLTKPSNYYDSTTKVPEGTFIKNGKLHMKNGYKVSYNSDQKIYTIVRLSNNGVTAYVTCSCKDGGNCGISQGQDEIWCTGDACCKILLSGSESDISKLPISGRNDSTLTWKVLVIPKTKIKSTSN